MSQQYPPPPPLPPYGQPYPPVAYGSGPAIDYRAPAKRASILMFVLAFLTLVFAGCIGLVSGYPLDQLPADSRQVLEDLDRQLRNESNTTLSTALKVFAVMMALPAVVLLVLGIFVRSGKRGWVIASLVLAGLMLAVLVLQMLGGLSQGAGGLANFCMLSIPASLFGLLIGFLISAYRAAGMVGRGMVPEGYPPMYGHQPGAFQGPYQGPQAPYGYGYGAPQAPPAPRDDDRNS